ncbi:MAG: hypothetical protein GY715_10040 [Planctomycetes bacterium]|nr:hypothetical protein [Planctomycetota bacterium]
MLPVLVLAIVTGTGIIDCNGNGIDDAIDIATGTSMDCDGDAVPDECQPCADCDDSGILDACEALAPGGLTGQYYVSESGAGSFSERVLVRFDDVIDFNWGNGSPDAALPDDEFTVRWTGAITAPVSGTYTFYTTTDDGVRLWIDEALLIDEWHDQSPTEWSGAIALVGGERYLFQMDYFEAGGGAEARLEWEAPGLPREVVPMSALSPLADTDDDGYPDVCGEDCNGNGIPDVGDILAGTSTDCDGNCVPDECDIVPPVPVGYWRFEDLGGVIVDSGPNGLDGIAAAVAPTTDVPVDPVPQTGEPNTFAIEFTDGLIEVTDPGGLLTLAGESFTIEAWVRLDQLSDTSGTGQRQYLLQKKVIASSGDVSDYSVLVQSGNLSSGLDQNFGKTSGFTGRELLVTFGTGTQTWGVTSNLEISDLDWHAVSVTYDADTGEVRFGRDGMFETIAVVPPGFFANTGPLIVGAHTNAAGNVNQHLKGAIDELRITAGALRVLRLLRSPVMADCNGNGEPDECDVATGFSEDCDANGIPDECDPDCNENGTPDGCDIAGGTSPDCQGDGIPDECQLVDNDCDGDGVPDACQLADEDCNGNGVVDSCDVAAATSDDCQPDGIPDECQVGEDVVLSYDDGGAEFGVRTNGGPFMAWLNMFAVEPGVSIIDAIDVMFVFMPLGTTVDVHVWSDPNGDGDPTDAQALWSGQYVVQELDVFLTIDVTDLDLGPANTRFFVGFMMPVTANDFPAAMDTQGSNFGQSWIVGDGSPIDPNDLASAAEFGTIDDILFPGHWLIRARMLGTQGDCNLNGIPDLCDIDAGTSEDVDGNGVPDECEDCNGNGTPDGLDIAGGTSLDCQGDGVPDECQLVNNDCNGDLAPDDCQLETLGDCNGNGVPDGCDIASGTSADTDGSGIPDECEDCNNNGILDGLDILLGTSDDCQPDGIPDECQLGDPELSQTYLWDDGTKDQNIGFVSPVVMGWLNHFTVQPGSEWISAIEIAWGNTVTNQPATLYVWSDPNGDGDIPDAQVLASVDTVTQNVNTNIFNVEPIVPTFVGPAGTSFFVGVIFDDMFNTAPAAVDTSEPDGEMFLFDGFGFIDPNDLTSGGAVTPIQNPGWDAMVRAAGFDGTFPLDCNDNGVPDDCDIDEGILTDVNGNGIADECECVGDIDGSGDVGFGDILAVIGAWGPCPGCPEDLNGNGAVDFADILVIIGAWGACP